jgi:hypothetical protein
MLNMSAKIGEARERMSLETRKCTLSLDCRIRSACSSPKGAGASFSEYLGFEGGMTGDLKGAARVVCRALREGMRPKGHCINCENLCPNSFFRAESEMHSRCSYSEKK